VKILKYFEAALIEDRKYLVKSDIVQKAITCLGRVPRYLEIFITLMNEITLELDLLNTISKCFFSTSLEIANIYSLTKWKKYLGNSIVGPIRMLLWSLAAKPVRHEDMLNGISIKQAEDNGMLILEEKNDKLYICVVRALNIQLKTIDDKLLDPFAQLGPYLFEYMMCNLRVLRQNLYCKLSPSTITLGDMYPGAIGRNADLATIIPSLPLQYSVVKGNPSSHDFLHYWPIGSVPLYNATVETVDFSKDNNEFSLMFNKQGGILLHNVSMASSSDACIIHPPKTVEAISMKSCQNINLGIAPNPLSQGVLKVGNKNDQVNKKTIWAEYYKATCTDHKAFYEKLTKDFSLFFVTVSNKPLINYDDLKKDPLSLPPKTIVVSLILKNMQEALLQYFTKTLYP
jgi:hypothetical protein